MKQKISLIIFLLSLNGLLFAGSYSCHFVKKISYSSMRDKTPNRIRRVNLWVIYRVDGNELLTRPDGVNRTFMAYYDGKYLGRDGTLYYKYKSNIGYIYALSEDMSEAIEMTPSGKTIFKGYCEPI